MTGIFIDYSSNKQETLKFKRKLLTQLRFFSKFNVDNNNLHYTFNLFRYFVKIQTVVLRASTKKASYRRLFVGIRKSRFKFMRSLFFKKKVLTKQDLPVNLAVVPLSVRKERQIFKTFDYKKNYRFLKRCFTLYR